MLLSTLAAAALAHNPHDPFYDLAVAPDFDVEALVLGARAPAQNWRPIEVVRSVDGGSEFLQSMEGLAATSRLSGLALSPAFAADGTVLVSTATGAWVSTDRGRTWSDAGLVGHPLNGAAITDGPSGPRLVVVEVDGSAWSSDDLGASWSPLPVAAGDGALVRAAGEHLGFASLAGVWLSHDGGETWRTLSVPGTVSVTLEPGGDAFVATLGGGVWVTAAGDLRPLVPGVRLDAIGVGPGWPADPLLVLARHDAAEILISEDGGQTFTSSQLHLGLSDQAPDRHTLDIRVPATATGERIYLSMFEGLLESDDRGASWVEFDTRPPHVITGLSVSPDFATDHAVAVGTYDGGVYLSRDEGDHFEVRNLGLVRPNVYDLELSAGGEILVAALGYVARGTQGATGYALDTLYAPGTYATQLGLSPAFPTDGYALCGTRGDGVLRTLDGGTTWAPVSPHLGQVTSVAIGVDPTLAVAGIDTGLVLSSVDGGETWTELFPASTGPAFVTRTVGGFLIGTVDGLFTWDGAAPVAVAGVSGPVEQVGAADDGTRFVVLRGGPVLRSDAGGPFVDLGLVEGLVPHELALSPDFASDGTLFAAVASRLYRSRDRGASWQRVDPDPVRFEETCQAVTSDRPPIGAPVDGASASTVRVLPEGEAVSLTFHGTGVDWIGATGGGVAEVGIDDAAPIEVDTAGPQVGNVLLARVVDLPLGYHTLTVRAVSGEVLVDAFDVTHAPPDDTTTPGTTPPLGETGDTGVVDPPDRDPPTDDDDGRGCGCTSGGAPAGGLGLVLLLLGLRRRAAR